MINKGPSHGARHGNTKRQRIYCGSQRSKEGKEEGVQIHFGTARVTENPQTAIGWDEELCAHYDAIAAEDHSYIATQAANVNVRMLFS